MSWSFSRRSRSGSGSRSGLGAGVGVGFVDAVVNAMVKAQAVSCASKTCKTERKCLHARGFVSCIYINDTKNERADV